MTYVNTSPLQSFMSRTDSHIIIVNFISESDLSMYGLRPGEVIVKNLDNYERTNIGSILFIWDKNYEFTEVI